MVTSIGDPFFGASAPVEGAVHSIKSGPFTGRFLIFSSVIHNQLV
jgi:hypothetical protein